MLITPSRTLTVIYQFDKTHGLAPYAPLIQGTDGNFYGTTTGGGSGLGGAVFKLSPTGKILVLFNFIQGTSPSVPYGGLVQATDGHFYGTTSQGNSTGGTMSDGTVFRIGASPSTPTFLHDFDVTTGRLPQDTLLQHTNGILYGDTLEGGDPSSGCGVFYSWNAGLNPFVSLVFTSGRVGKTIQILGQGFTGTIGVSFNGVAATTFTIVSEHLSDGCGSDRRDDGLCGRYHSGGHADEQQNIPRHAADSEFQPSERPSGNGSDHHGRQPHSDDESLCSEG